MTGTCIPDELLQAAGTSALGPRDLVDDIRRAVAHPLRGAFDEALATVPPADLEEMLTGPDPAWRLKSRDGAVDERLARAEVVIAEIGRILYRKRSESLRQVTGRPSPYDHPALADVEPDGDLLVPLSTFKTGLGGLSRRGFVFSLAIPLRAENSSYWSLQALLGLSGECRVHVRPDPIMVAPELGYRSLLQKMQVFGRGLDWARLHDLKDEECTRWMPDELTNADCEFTDLAWRRRGDEVHFECEEVPKRAGQRPARYFHAIYQPAQACFSHADFAVRYYTPGELDSRRALHLKDLAKVGTRVKLFRIDGVLGRKDWATVLASAFVWNNDLRRYVSMERDFTVERSPVRPREGS